MLTIIIALIADIIADIKLIAVAELHLLHSYLGLDSFFSLDSSVLLLCAAALRHGGD